MPQNTVDPVVLAAMIVIRLQAIISRETPPTEPAVLTVGSLRAGTTSNIIPDQAVLELNLRTYTNTARRLEVFDSFPLTSNDDETTARVAGAFGRYFGDRARGLDLQMASEDFSDIPRAAHIPYTCWGIGGTDPQTWHAAELAGRVHEDIPADHSPMFLPVLQPTLRTGTGALVTAALAWLDPDAP